MMYAARILYPVKTLGPGDRVGIWLCGCSHGCPGCSNPELWSCGEQFRITRERLLQLVGSIAQGAEVNGFTITGGDPLEQSEELALLLPELRKISGDSGIQDFPAADGMVSVGIHRPDYPQELERRLAEKSIIKCDTEENGNDGA